MSGADFASMTEPDVRIRFGASTHVGRIREHNEDSLIAQGRVFAIADGIGGHAAGEVASGIAVECLGELNTLDSVRAEDVAAVLHRTNARILESAVRNPEQTGMGTTVAGLTVVDVGRAAQWMVFSVGDSRVYRLLGDQMSMVTQDHSLVREMVEDGLITAEQAVNHHLRNVVTRSLGTDPAPSPDMWVLSPQLGERFVVCSDGLSDELDDLAITVALQSNDDPQEAAEALCLAAVDAGGRDNVSVIVVALGPSGDARDETERGSHHTLSPS